MLFETDQKFDLIYCDYIYQNLEFSWVDKYWNMLKPNSIFCCQTDDSTEAEIKIKLKSMPNAIWLNTCIMIQEWGGTSKRFFPRKHDYIFIFANGENYKFYSDRIQIPKVTAGTKFDKKKSGMKTPCDVFYDLGNFSTVSKERIKDPETDRNLRWQKSQKLMSRLLLPFTDENDWILEPFGGTFSACRWAVKNNRNCVGIEYDERVFNIGKKNIELYDHEN
jgi:DNA modification methylase